MVWVVGEVEGCVGETLYSLTTLYCTDNTLIQRYTLYYTLAHTQTGWCWTN